MSGGGSKGAYEAGAVHSIVNTLPAPDNQYDVVSGVSVGAINSASFALFAKGDELQLGDFILNLWKNMKNDMVWKFRDNIDPVGPLFDNSGFVDDTPLYEFLHGILSEFANIARRTIITTANDVLTGNQM